MSAPVLSETWASREVERIVSKARQHPDNLEHHFATLPQGSRDLLAWSMFTAMVVGDGEKRG